VEVKPLDEQPAALTSTDNQGALPADVIVRVGSWVLTADDFNERLKLLKQSVPDFNDKDSKSRETVLSELVRQQLLVKDAENSDVGQTKDIKDAVEDFRRTLLVQELAQRITKGVEAKDEDAQKYYDSNKSLFLKWKVRQILVDDEATAKNLLVQILQGGDFAALAKASSKDKTAPEGGLIADPAQSPLEVQKSILALEAGGTSSVFKGTQGYYIIHVDEKNPIPFKEVKDNLKSNLTLRKQQEVIIEHIKTLEQKTKIEYNNELLGTDTKRP
jgi:parvulin-like peptidyl-prolyl isomerase